MQSDSLPKSTQIIGLSFNVFRAALIASSVFFIMAYALLSGCANLHEGGLDTTQNSIRSEDENQQAINSDNETILPAKQIKLAITSEFGDNQTYVEGDELYYYVSADRECYLLLIYQDAQDNLIQVLPSGQDTENYLPAADFIRLPKAGSNYEFIVEAPFGSESVYAFASSKPFDSLARSILSNGFYLLEGASIADIRSQLRTFSHNSGAFYGEARTKLNTVPQLK